MSSSSGSEDTPWIQWFLSLKGHELLCEVHRSYIEDSFNLYGLRQIIPHYAACLDVILDRGEIAVDGWTDLLGSPDGEDLAHPSP